MTKSAIRKIVDSKVESAFKTCQDIVGIRYGDIEPLEDVRLRAHIDGITRIIINQLEYNKETGE